MKIKNLKLFTLLIIAASGFQYVSEVWAAKPPARETPAAKMAREIRTKANNTAMRNALTRFNESKAANPSGAYKTYEDTVNKLLDNRQLPAPEKTALQGQITTALTAAQTERDRLSGGQQADLERRAAEERAQKEKEEKEAQEKFSKEVVAMGKILQEPAALAAYSNYLTEVWKKLDGGWWKEWKASYPEMGLNAKSAEEKMKELIDDKILREAAAMTGSAKPTDKPLSPQPLQTDFNYVPQRILMYNAFEGFVKDWETKEKAKTDWDK